MSAARPSSSLVDTSFAFWINCSFSSVNSILISLKLTSLGDFCWISEMAVMYFWISACVSGRERPRRLRSSSFWRARRSSASFFSYT